MKSWILELSFSQLGSQLGKWGIKEFVARQIFQWLYQKNNLDTTSWSNISKVNREKLDRRFSFGLPEVLAVQTDKEGTTKHLLRLSDGCRIEAVSIPEKGHRTFCLSTQVGCPLQCRFCATGQMGFRRNLTAGEILSQILVLRKNSKNNDSRLNLVFMGMGEPLLNYENLKQTLQIILDSKGLNVSPRHITLSTAGIFPELDRVEDEFPRIKIAFSLNSADDELRRKLMPGAARQPLSQIGDYFRSKKRKNRITFEYVLLDGINDRLEDARKLAHWLRGIPCKINLIPFNPNPTARFQTPALSAIDRFQEYLRAKGLTANIRWSKGKNIGSACGQLATPQS